MLSLQLSFAVVPLDPLHVGPAKHGFEFATPMVGQECSPGPRPLIIVGPQCQARHRQGWRAGSRWPPASGRTVGPGCRCRGSSGGSLYGVVAAAVAWDCWSGWLDQAVRPAVTPLEARADGRARLGRRPPASAKLTRIAVSRSNARTRRRRDPQPGTRAWPSPARRRWSCSMSSTPPMTRVYGDGDRRSRDRGRLPLSRRGRRDVLTRRRATDAKPVLLHGPDRASKLIQPVKGRAGRHASGRLARARAGP